LKKEKLPYQSQHVYLMWNKILNFYGINRRDELFPESGAYEIDWSFETPANTKSIVVKAVESDRGDDEIERLEQWTGYVRIKRPNGHDSLERTWELARSEAEAEVKAAHSVLAY